VVVCLFFSLNRDVGVKRWWYYGDGGRLEMVVAGMVMEKSWWRCKMEVVVVVMVKG